MGGGSSKRHKAYTASPSGAKAVGNDIDPPGETKNTDRKNRRRNSKEKKALDVEKKTLAGRKQSREKLKEKLQQKSLNQKLDATSKGRRRDSKLGSGSAWNGSRKAKIRAVGRMAAMQTDSKAAQRAKIRHKRANRLESNSKADKGLEVLVTHDPDGAKLPKNLSTKSFILDECAIGKGSYGYVRLGKLKSNGITYALKQTRKVDIVKKRAMRYVLAERKTLGMANHPFVLGIHGSFQDNRNVYLILEYMPGGDLYYVASTHADNCVPEPDALFYGQELFLALEYIHSIGILHRDVKPENCLLDKQGHLKLCDFGFARTVDKDGRCFTNLGTPHYLAPEQLDIHSKAGYTSIVDWWSYACTLFSLLNGEPPFGNSDNTRYEVYLRVMKSKYKIPSSCPKDAKALFKKMFIAKAEKRLAKPEDIKLHSYFSDTNWDGMLQKAIPVPHKPTIQKNGKNNFYKIKIRKVEDEEEAADMIASKSHYWSEF